MCGGEWERITKFLGLGRGGATMGLTAGLPLEGRASGAPEGGRGLETEVTKVTAQEHDAKLLNAFCYWRFKKGLWT